MQRLTISMFMHLFMTVSKKALKLKIFAISQFWFVGVVGQKIAVATSNSIYILFGPLLAPIPNFIQIRWKAQKLKIFCYWSVLVGWGGRAKNGRSYFKLNLCSFWAIISLHTKFHPNLMKNTEVENFCYWLVLVGRGGSGWVGSHTFPVLGFWGILYRGVHITQID